MGQAARFEIDWRGWIGDWGVIMKRFATSLFALSVCIGTPLGAQEPAESAAEPAPTVEEAVQAIETLYRQIEDLEKEIAERDERDEDVQDLLRQLTAMQADLRDRREALTMRVLRSDTEEWLARPAQADSDTPVSAPETPESGRAEDSGPTGERPQTQADQPAETINTDPQPTATPSAEPEVAEPPAAAPPPPSAAQPTAPQEETPQEEPPRQEDPRPAPAAPAAEPRSSEDVTPAAAPPQTTQPTQPSDRGDTPPEPKPAAAPSAPDPSRSKPGQAEQPAQAVTTRTASEAGTEGQGETQSSAQPPQTVGQAPEDADEVEVAVLADVGGVLTPKGTFVLEPSIEYNHSSDNRFFFSGVQVIDVVLIGLIEATDVDRDAVTASLGLRYGVTNRFEVDVRGSYFYREDRNLSIPFFTNADPVFEDLSGSGFGDVNIGAHYQINSAGGKWPAIVANVRTQIDTGRGPFEVDRAADGTETELPTGSGFLAVEPSLTFIKPSDPAVIFGNIGYVVNIPENVNTLIGNTLIDRVDPGDIVRASFGLGFGLNQQLSLSLSYDHSFVLPTTTRLGSTVEDPNAIDFFTTESEPAQVGSFVFGMSYALSKRQSLNISAAIGATDDAPDARISFRLPIRF